MGILDSETGHSDLPIASGLTHPGVFWEGAIILGCHIFERISNELYIYKIRYTPLGQPLSTKLTSGVVVDNIRLGPCVQSLCKFIYVFNCALPEPNKLSARKYTICLYIHVCHVKM